MEKDLDWISTSSQAPGQFTSCQLCKSKRISPLFETVKVWKCSSCGLIFRNPQPTDEELFRLYNESYRPEKIATHSTRMAGTTLDLARYYVQCLAKTEDLQSKRVVDFGAGLGTMSMALKEHGADVVAIEPFASEECRKANIRTYTSLAEMAAHEPKFDAVVAIDVIEHVRRPWETLSELRQVLKPKGWLCVKTLNASGLNALLTRESWREMAKPDHLVFFTPATMERIFEDAGFQRYNRLKWFTRYSQNLVHTAAHFLIEATNLDGELRYVVHCE